MDIPTPRAFSSYEKDPTKKTLDRPNETYDIEAVV